MPYAGRFNKGKSCCRKSRANTPRPQSLLPTWDRVQSHGSASRCISWGADGRSYSSAPAVICSKYVSISIEWGRKHPAITQICRWLPFFSLKISSKWKCMLSTMNKMIQHPEKLNAPKYHPCIALATDSNSDLSFAGGVTPLGWCNPDTFNYLYSYQSDVAKSLQKARAKSDFAPEGLGWRWGWVAPATGKGEKKPGTEESHGSIGKAQRSRGGERVGGCSWWRRGEKVEGCGGIFTALMPEARPTHTRLYLGCNRKQLDLPALYHGQSLCWEP